MTELLKEGDLAPQFSLNDGQGNLITLKDFLGKKIVLYFYPKDATPGCTKEACGFRDRYGDFVNANTIIIGISKDSEKTHSHFAAKFGLPFILLSDAEGVTCQDYGVWQLKKLYGKEYMGISRSTFIINEKGYIDKVFPNVKVAGHVEEVLKFIQQG